MDFIIKTKEDLIDAVREIGFLPPVPEFHSGLLCGRARGTFRMVFR